MIQFRLFGIPVTILPWFWLTMAIIGGAFSIENSDHLLRTALFVLAGFISILVHEFGHALTIKFFRLPTEIVLQAFGGYATHPAGVLNRPKSFLVTAAGPGLQMLLGAAALATLQYAPLPETQILYFVRALVWVSFGWAILNCFPIYPLDGGRMLESILGPRRQKLVFAIGLATAVLLAILAVSMLRAPILALFMGFFAWQNYQRMQQARS